MRTAENTMFEKTTRAIFSTTIFTFLVFCAIAHGSIILEVNGLDPAPSPLELLDPQSLEIALFDTNPNNVSYDLTLTATSGEFLYNGPTSSTLPIQTSDLESFGGIEFQFADDFCASVVSLITNQPLTIDGQTAPANTEVYRLVLFNIQTETESKVIVFGSNYEILSTPAEEPAEEMSPMTAQSSSASSEPMAAVLPEPVFFNSAKECPDLDGDNFVNFADFAIFTRNWLKEEIGLEGDFNSDNVVDVNDLLVVSEYWMTEVYYPVYYADPLPYTTSFEIYQHYADAYYGSINLDYQMGWQVNAGDAFLGLWWAWVGEYAMEYQFAAIGPDTVISKEFEDTGSNNEFIHLNFIPAKDQKINIINGTEIVASVWFAEDMKIHVLDNGSYINTNIDYTDVYNSCRQYFMDYINEGYTHEYDQTWTTLRLKLNWDSNTYEMSWNGEPNAVATFDQNYEVLTAFQMVTGDDWGVIDSLTISGNMADQPWVSIESPCACDTDADLKGRVRIIGTAEGLNFGGYQILYCPVELAVGSPNQWYWQLVDEGCQYVQNGVLGYWDTSRIPNGYYHLAVVVYDNLGYAPRGLEVIFKTLSIGGTVVYDEEAFFPVVGDLKCNTFYHEEEPDISVPWAGTFPFEFRRVFNNNRRYFTQPLAPGWSHNSQIILTENCQYNWETRDSGPFLIPAYDNNMLAFGYIWLQYPDGSCKLFRNQNPEYEGPIVIYRPWPENNTGEYIERGTETNGFMAITGIEYNYYNREGIRMRFYAQNLYIPWPGSQQGIIGWDVQTGINSMSDRFGNTLTYNWRNVGGRPIGVSSISDGRRQIEFTFDNYHYYTKAELKIGSTVYRTIQFGIGDLSHIVSHTGSGVDEQGVLGNRQYIKLYAYDDELNLRDIVNINNPDQYEWLVGIDYDNYGRVATRWDVIDNDNYLETTYNYSFFDPNIPGHDDHYLRTVQLNDTQAVVTVQNDKGAILVRQIIPSDGCAVTNTALVYNDLANPLKPTDIYELFDGFQRHVENDYNIYGDLLEQQLYVDGSNMIASEITYHPDYSLETSRTSWQGLNKTGPKVQKLSIYGNADGTENPHGRYLVAERVLLDDADSTDPNEQTWAVTRFKYYDTANKKGLVKEITDPEGFVTLIAYDDNGYMTQMRKGTDPNNTEIVKRYQYDAIGQLLFEANPMGGIVRHDYDGFGRLWRARKYEDPAVMYQSDPNFSAPVLAETLFGYNEQGFRTYEKLETGGEIETTHTYNGLPKRKTFDDSSFVEFSYDTHGNKIQEYYYEYTTQNDWSVTFGYDSMDRLTETNWFDYDDATLVKRQLSEYYGSGQKKYDEFYGYENTLEKKVSYSFDILTRLVSTTTDPQGFALTVHNSYDAAGNRISVTDPKDSVIFADYDNANRQVREYFAAEEDGSPVPTKETSYYNNGKVFSETRLDYDGSTVLSYREFAYDARGRTIQTIEQIDAQNNAITNYWYFDAFADPNDPNVPRTFASVVIEDAEEKETSIILDGFGRQLIRQYPSGDYEESQYRGDGTLWKKAVWDDQNVKQWMEYGHDDYGRVTDVNSPDMGYVQFLYDGFGRRTLVTDGRNAVDNIGGNHQISYSIDILNRIASYTNQDGYTVNYAYRHDGQKQAITVYDSGLTKIYDVKHTFDSANRLEYVHNGLEEMLDDYIARLTYDDNGNRNELSYFLTGDPFMGSVVTISYAYNPDNYLTGFTTTGGPAFSFDASQSGNIDGLGCLVSADETIGATSRALSYAYDNRSQLKTVSIGNINGAAWTGSYVFHKDGNVDTRTEDGAQTDHSYTGDLLTTVGTNNLMWDENGNMATGIGVDITYNLDNRIQSATAGSNSIACIYDPDGQMISKTTTTGSGVSTEKYILDVVGDYPMILVVTEPNSLTSDRYYFHANGQTLMQEVNESQYFYLHDQLGSTRQIINASGAVVNTYTYDPWGNAFASETSETIGNHYRFANYYWDAATGLYYLNARWYDPMILRLTGRDPVKGKYEKPLTLHQYLYCLNDPVNMVDPIGKNARAKAMVAPIMAGHATHALAVTIVTYAVWSARDALMPLGFALESGIKDVMTSVAMGFDFADALAKASVTFTDHLNDLVSLSAELTALEKELGNAGGPKKRGPLEELIRKIKEQIDGKVKEMRQKWPDKMQ